MAPFWNGSLSEVSRDVLAVVVAAGRSRRFDDPSGIRKQYRELDGRPLLLWAVQPFLDHPAIARTVLVLPPNDVAEPPDWLRGLPVTLVGGGVERGDSVRNGLLALDDGLDTLVLIHDGARPFVTRDLIDRVIAAADGGGVIPRIPVTDTVKEVDVEGLVVGTLDRTRFWRVQTPQAFPLDALRMAYDRAVAENVVSTDDAALFERYGLPVRAVEGDETNIKVTSRVDFDLAEILAHRLPRPI